MIFEAKKQPKLEESIKVYGMTPIRKAIAKCDLNGEKSDDCKKALKEIGIDFVGESE